MKIIDSHLHLFDLQRGKYPWLQPENPPFWPDKSRINQNFSQRDLFLSSPLELGGFIHIEAGFDNDNPWREIAWLEKSCSGPFKSIGTICLTHTEADFNFHLTQLTQFSSVIGGRHILDADLFQQLENKNNKLHIIQNLHHLAASNCLFEAQFDVNNTAQVNRFIALIKEVPTLRVALNHAGFPPSNHCARWDANITALAKLPMIWVKASGWEMSDRHYPNSVIEQRIKTLITAFGEDRVMLASNFPLTLFRTSYQSLWRTYQQMKFPIATINKLLYENAKQFYLL